VGFIAAVLVARLCYVRFRGHRLDERPAEPELTPSAAAAKPASLASN
jgi:hypothetical protein